MKQWIRRGAALGLALALTVTAASASQAMGWDVHTGRAPLSQGASLGKNVFWSDTYSDLRTEYYVEYSPNASVVPTVAYGSKVTDRVTLSGMAQTLESQGKRVVSGLNGDWYVLSTGAPTGLVVTDGIVRATGYYNDTWAIGFNADGTAFIARNGLSVSVSFGGQAVKLGGGINKVRKLTDSAAVGGLTLLTDDFAATTQNTEPGVDVILSPVDDGTGTYAVKPTIGRQTQYVVEQVLESTGSIPIPEGKAVLTLNAKESEEALARLRALQPGDTVTLTVSSSDQRWSQAVQALGGVSKLVTNGQVDSGLDASRTAWPAIGIKADGTVIFYAMDGKQPGYSVGATQGQVAQRLIELGCVEAICMDGGGSTTIGVTYPDQEGMQVVNKPSDGSQRKNSTAIFLTTGLQPTGELASYYVTPSDSILLSGATVQLSATGLDTSYFPTSGGGVSWSVSSGGGTVDENGLFTAGAESGFAQVTATDGSASGTGYITTVRTPDEITLTNEATGAAVASLNLDPGGQVDLKASASYRKLALTAQDTCFTWSADPEVGTVDANGVFTAGTKSASGNLTVSAGGKTLTVPVSIAGHVKTLEDCEGDLASFGATSTASYGAETGLDYVHNGRQSLRMTYDASTGGTASLNSALPIPAGESWLGVWVYGDGSGNTLMATAADASLQSRQFLLTALDFTGWKYVSAELPEGAATLTSLDVIYGGGAGGPAGTIWLDQFTTSNENVSDTIAPTVRLSVSGTQLTAAVSDNVDRTIPQANVILTYDGATLNFTWNEASGTLTATLPAADSGYHRVSVTACDASGNLARASADVKPAGTRTSPFGDMAGHWAEPYATYLYDTGVSKGTGVEIPVYQPEKNITRAEFFAMVARWMDLDLTQYANVELPFVDAASIPDWALNEVKAMYSLGILKGGADTIAPTVRLSVSGTQLTAAVSDNVDRTIPQANVILTYDGATLNFTWNEASGTLTATLPAADSGYHRVSVTACDASGNLARASADVKPAGTRTSPFGDMAGHWAEPYATYLYDTGVSKGTGVEIPVYQPEKNITRAEFFAMVARWMDLDLTQYANVELPFVDAASIPDWALNEVKAMYSLGILKGGANESGLTVNALATISRAEAMTILGRTQARGYAEPELTFSDAGQVPDWAAGYLRSLVGQGVITGNDNRIRPNDLLTRGEVAKLLYAML